MLLISSAFFYIIFLNIVHSSNLKTLTVNTLFGSVDIKDPLIIEIINSPAIQRLKYIDSAGPPKYFMSLRDNSRYDHSLGVFFILRLYNLSKEEQIAGLLHDISHTAFSHATDGVFNNKNYHDNIFLSYLHSTTIPKILKKYNINVDKFCADFSTKFIALESKIPDICADRIEYILHVSYLLEKITKHEIIRILNNLKFSKGKWYFLDIYYARKFAFLSLHLTECFFNTPDNMMIYHWFSKLLKTALDLEIIDNNDIHFRTDNKILNKLKDSKNETIKILLDKCINYKNSYIRSYEKNDSNYSCYPKFRGVDPLVLNKNKLQKLSKIDIKYRKEFLRVKTKTIKGVHFILK